MFPYLYLYNNVVLAMTMPIQWLGLKTQSLLTQHYYYYYVDCYMQTKYIENYYNKGGPDMVTNILDQIVLNV